MSRVPSDFRLPTPHFRARYLTDRAVNGLLLLTLVALACTGVAGLFANAEQHWILFEVHRAGAAAFLVLLVPKGSIVVRSLRRKVRGDAAHGVAGTIVSLVLLLLTIAVVAAALGWALARGPWDGLWGLSLIVVHWYLALALLPLAVAHIGMRWRRTGQVPRAVDFRGRRRLLALGGAAALALATWGALAAGAAGTVRRTARRRF